VPLVLLALLAWQMPASAATDVVRLTSVGSTQGETSMSISWKKPSVMLVGYNDSRNINGTSGNMGYAYTTDGGTHASDWHRDLYLKGITRSDPGSLGWGFASDPVVVYSAKDDTFKFATVGVNRTNSKRQTGIVYDSSSKTAKAPTSGLTWKSPLTIGPSVDTQHNPGSPSCSGTWTDKPDMSVDNNSGSPFYGRVYVTWHERNCGDTDVQIWVTHHDVGTNDGWSNPVQISVSGVNWGPSIRAGGINGRVYIGWCHPLLIQHCSGEDPAFVMLSQSLDGGATWTSPANVVQFALVPNPLPGHSFANNSHPVLAVDVLNGLKVSLVVPVWNGTDTDVLYVSSTDAGQTWSAPTILGFGPHDQYLPWLSVSPNGSTLWACYYTQGYSPPLIDVACTESTDWINFADPVRASANSFDPGASKWIGDYIASATGNDGRYHAAWGGYQACCPGANLDAYFAEG
jgi:hypothetical protein